MSFVQNLNKVITLLILSNACQIAYSKSNSTNDCERHPVKCAIKTLQPSIGNGESYLLSNLIVKYSKKHNVDPYRIVAIAMQESSLKNVNKISKEGIITDVGLFQFHIGTIDMFKLDVRRLQDDVAYAVERACWLLSLKLKECSSLGKDAWACYHSSSTKHRLKYQELVNKHYIKIKY